MTTTTETQKLSPAMRQALRAFYFHATVNYTGGEHGDVERMNEAGGTLHGSYRYWPGMRASTLEALKRRGLFRRGASGVAAHTVAAIDVVDDELLEVLRDRGAAQGHRLLAVDEHRRRWCFAGPGQ